MITINININNHISLNVYIGLIGHDNYSSHNYFSNNKKL